jgi:LPXTG-motif cell wall-anchored protein
VLLCNPKIATGSYSAVTDCHQLVAPQTLSQTGSGTIANVVTGDGGHAGRTATGDYDWECDTTGAAEGVVDATDYGAGSSKVYNDCYVVVREGSIIEADLSKNELFKVRFVDSAGKSLIATQTKPSGSAKTGGSSTDWSFALVIGALVSVGAGGVALLRRRRSPATAVTD